MQILESILGLVRPVGIKNQWMVCTCAYGRCIIRSTRDVDTIGWRP